MKVQEVATRELKAGSKMLNRPEILAMGVDFQKPEKMARAFAGVMRLLKFFKQ